MLVARAYIKDMGITTISFDKDIQSLNASRIIDDSASLERKLAKEKNNNAIGIVDFTVGKIVLYSDNTYKGVIYASVSKLEGKWQIS